MKMVDEVRRFGGGRTQYIRYTGNGEPLVHPQIYDMLDYAVKNSGTFVTLTTNGKILNVERVKRLFESGLHLVDVSLDAVDAETYSKIRVGGNLRVSTQNVINLIKIRNETGNKTKVVVSFVEQPENATEVEEFHSFWQDQGADEIVIRRLHSAAAGVASIAENLWKETDKKDRFPCLYPWERILLNPRGELAFCPQDWTHGSKIIEYDSTTIKEVWEGSFYRELRRAHKCNKFEGFEFCGKCPDWLNTRWPGEGRSYADLVEEFREDFGLINE